MKKFIIFSILLGCSDAIMPATCFVCNGLKYDEVISKCVKTNKSFEYCVNIAQEIACVSERGFVYPNETPLCCTVARTIEEYKACGRINF